jgi:hypothetical protein
MSFFSRKEAKALVLLRRSPYTISLTVTLRNKRVVDNDKHIALPRKMTHYRRLN